MDGLGYRRFSAFFTENLFIDPYIFLVLKMGFGDQKAVVRISVQFACEPEAMVTVLFKNVSPLAGL
jgi:hypothetical protein